MPTKFAGAHRATVQMRKQVVRDLFKCCLVWAQGYALYAEFPKSVLLEMHDMGASDKTFLPYWHYRNLTEPQIRSGVIEPLKRHGARLACLVNAGFVDRKTQRVLNPWQQERVADGLDPAIVHDYASLKSTSSTATGPSTRTAASAQRRRASGTTATSRSAPPTSSAV